MASMRGLTLFISDIRNCQSKDAEEKRVYKELAKIREHFSNSKRSLNSYDKKKYVWKMLYMFMLGYNIDFGHHESVGLICAPKYSEKYTGYMAASLLLSAKSPHLEQIVNAVRNDLMSFEPLSQSLALSMVANLGGAILVEELSVDIVRLVTSERSRLTPEIAKKALTCLTRLVHDDKRITEQFTWSDHIAEYLLSSSIEIIMSVCNLMLVVIPIHGFRAYTDCYPGLVRNLCRVVLSSNIPADYSYYQTPCPWLQVKLLKLLQLFPYPQAASLQTDLLKALDRITSRTEVTHSINKNNTDHSILFEAIKLIIHYKEEVPTVVRAQCVSLLGRFISVKEANIRYIGLETMAILAQNSSSVSMLERHQSSVLISLRDPDVSIRKRALDVLFGMSYTENVTDIVGELLDVVIEADYNLKEDLVLKTAILAEKFGQDLQWYIDVIISLITHAGDYVSSDICNRVIQVVIGFENNPDTALQEYAATRSFLALSAKHAHENMVKLGAYLIAEFSATLMAQGKSAELLFETLHKHFPYCSNECKSILLTAYMKLAHLAPAVRSLVIPVFEGLTDHIDPDLQQRAFEYSALLACSLELTSEVLGPMPTYKEDLKRQNIVLKRMVSMGKAEEKSPAQVNLLDL